MSPVRISVVSYLNSKPFIYGLKHFEENNQIELQLDNPADCAAKLIDNRVDIGLVPVAILPLLKKYSIISDYCIGAVGEVSSVNLYSEVPLNQIKKVMLDYQSRTSVTLVKVLAKHHWHINPEWEPAPKGFESMIAQSTGAVVIGDRTFDLTGKFPFVYDLALEWFNFTKLPFVFACWVANKDLPSEFVQKFNAALSIGITNIPNVVNELATTHQYTTDVEKYLTQYISYSFDSQKQLGLNKFLTFLK